MKNKLKTEEFEKIVNQLMGYLEAPSSKLPSTQVFTFSHLRSLLVASRDKAKCPKSITGKLLIEHLIKSGLAEKLETVSENGYHRSPLYYVGTGGAHSIDALEILQAVKPKGIICYFSAIAYHQLTTQLLPHHHIATLKQVTELPEEKPDNSGEIKIPKLGTYLFKYNDTPYYWTQRDKKLVPGVQSVYLSDKAIVTVTTLEQTMLDTLHRPWSCGGPAVVLEAWEKGLEKMNESLMTEYLRSIDKPLYIRRVGCMFDFKQYKVADPDLVTILKNAKEKSDKPIEPLLPATPSGKIDRTWNLELPE